MRYNFGWVMLLVLLCDLPFAARATTYFVAQNGNDASNGLDRVSAWQTIQKAADEADPGDVILVLPGTYAGARLLRSGTEADPIILRSDTPLAAVLDRPGSRSIHNCILDIDPAEHWIVEGFTVTNSPRYGIAVFGADGAHIRNVTVRGNCVQGSASTGIFTAFADDPLIENNESGHNGEHGIYHSNSGDRPVIRNNVLHHNANSGLHMNADKDMGGDGIISGALVENNRIYRNGAGGAGINMDGVTHSTVRNNLLWDTPNNSGIALFRGNAAVASHGNLVVNNTIIMASTGGWAINLSQAQCVSNRVLNNIAYTYHSWRGAMMIADPALDGFECDYNVIMNRFSTDVGDTRIDLAAWRALGYGLHSLVAVPADLFVSPGTDHHLKSASPAIDAGSPAIGASTDLDGVQRPLDGNDDGRSVPDVGAHEFVHPAADSDGDTMRDADELEAGTDPTRQSSCFRLGLLPSATPAALVLHWPSAGGRRYDLSHAAHLSADFGPVTGGLPATPPLNVYTVGADSVAGFYRIQSQRL